MSVASSVSILPSVRLEVHQGGRRVPYVFDQVDFLIGAVAGCDLRVPGADLPAVLCLLARHPDGVRLRRLAPTQIMLLNGQPVSRADLVDGDRLTVGALDIYVRLEAAAANATDDGDAVEAAHDDLAEREANLQIEREQLSRERDRLQQERDAWIAERDKTPVRPVRVEIGADILQREMAISERGDEQTHRTQLLDARAAEIERHKQEIAVVRQELSDIRQQLYDRYQERRDRLAGLKESVDRAARKVQDGKRELERERDAFAATTADVHRRDADLKKLLTTLEDDRKSLDAERQTWLESQKDIRGDIACKLADLTAREERLASQKQTLEARERQYQTDVLRLDRRQGDLETRERQVAEQSAQLQSQQEQLRIDGAELETQARELDECRSKAQTDLAAIEEQKREHDVRGRQLDQRAAALEGQQTALTTLRGKLERMRDEFRQHDQALEAQRLAHDALVRTTTEKQERLARLEAELEARDVAANTDRHQLTERQAMLAAALAKLTETQERIAADEHTVQEQTKALDERAASLSDQEALLRGRLEQLADAQNRLDIERQTLRERTIALAQTEQAREALQEQLRRRAEELAAKQKLLHEQLELTQADQARLAKRDAEFNAETRSARESLDARQLALDEQSANLDRRRRELADLEALQAKQLEDLSTKSRQIAEEQLSLADQQARNQTLWLEHQERVRLDRDELDALRHEAKDLLLELPDLELRAGTAIDRLSHAREQLRDHLSEMQTFIRQTHDDLESAQARIRHERAELAQQDTDLRRAQDEHRVALVAFRQQTIDWQARIKEIERLLKKEDNGLVNRQARIDDQARQLDENARDLAQENAVLGSQKETVTEQQQDLDRHVGDLRDWYRHKMRELSGGPDDAEIIDASIALEADDPLVPTERDILQIVPADVADQTLADALAANQIIDAAAAHALLVEARRQRRSLKQVVLASAAATPYQLALLETGRTDALILGPFRVVDRLRQTAHETIYRAFDPRRGRETIVRHLNEDFAGDAVLPDEYRQRFGQLVLPDAHVAGTLEVLDIEGRPAVCQEWLAGLPASDWPPLAAAPGVCYRLLTQAALGLSSLHKHGLVHGRLAEPHLLLTREGLLKICGANEPSWLHGADEGAASPVDDLRRLGRIVSGWCTPSGVRKGPKAKPLPEKMIAILNRLQADDGVCYPTARALLDDLDQASNDVPANPEAWDRLLRYVRDHAQPEATLRQSA